MSYDLDIVTKITESFNHLSDAEKKVATVILEDLTFTAGASITDIANRAQVSEATITRFAKSVNCENVRSLKLRLAQSIAVGQRFISETKDEVEGLHGHYDAIKKSLDDNAQLITEDIINSAVEKILDARQVLTFGVGGGSTMIAQESQHRLFRLGYPATAYSDPMLMHMAASTLSNNDAVICISASGVSPDVKESAQIAKQYNAKVVAITRAGSELANIADAVLPIKYEETDFIFSPSTSRYAMLAALDVLMTELAVAKKRTSRDKLRRIKLVLDSYFNSHERLPLGD
ncbi:MurR/RpiR family transcriptional regulator [Alteromonadaceae bacterium M269]|nr:MurR/RpiR family transcriptional regulator [Alteromonadaceae bacterium M269]